MEKLTKKEPSGEDQRNLEFEAKIAEEIPESAFIETGRKMYSDFKEAFALNWTFRNDLAKIVVTLSAGLLALLASAASSSIFKTVPVLLLLLTMLMLFLTIFFNIISLWIIIKVTNVSLDFMLLSADFAKTHKQMIKEHRKFEPSKIEKFFRIPFDKALNNHNKSLKYRFFRKKVESLGWTSIQ
jgi:hypothetical protein